MAVVRTKGKNSSRSSFTTDALRARLPSARGYWNRAGEEPARGKRRRSLRVLSSRHATRTWDDVEQGYCDCDNTAA